jgi:hypothetical protein
MWYTRDGTDPTNAFPSEGPISGNALLSLPIPNSSLTFKIRAFRTNYKPSDTVTREFSTTNFIPNRISFGFEGGEASSEFIASAGQFFYAPVTMRLLPNTKMYSLQFNVTVTNTIPGTNPVAPGAVAFTSMLKEKIESGFMSVYRQIPPGMYAGGAIDPPPAPRYDFPGRPDIMDLRFVGTNNLLGVGWLERLGKTNLYDTTKQDLIKYSIAHDTVFDSANGQVVVGGYAFLVPSSAANSNLYQIQLGRPSATADGIGAPGSDLFISTPTNGSLAAGAINSIKNVSIGQRKYIAGDVYPFGWFNAGDFGKGYLLNADVMQVFQSAIYFLDYPLYDANSWNGIGYTNVSDFYDAMDSCGRAVAVKPNYGEVVLETAASSYSTPNDLFYGTDTDINRIAFGDGILDVTDVYVTFRRSLDPNLDLYRRFWTNGIRAAEITTNTFRGGGGSPDQEGQIFSGSDETPAISFACTDIVTNAGQTLQIPIKANVRGTFPLRVLMLNLTVEPLDGSPALTDAVQFAPAPGLGQPTLRGSRGNGNYSGTWLNNQIAGFTGDSVLGILTVRIPANCPANAAYAIHFDHASGSPNGIASFPKQTRTGLITLSSRSTSSFNDGIPDSWRLRYFGSIYNILSQAGADADGDGATNLQESKADTDPNDAASVLRLRSSRGQAKDFVIRWPTIANKRYVVEHAPTLYGPAWTPVLTNTGTGFDIECHDANPGAASGFYRVRLAE